VENISCRRIDQPSFEKGFSQASTHWRADAFDRLGFSSAVACTSGAERHVFSPEAIDCGP
jgi:hypothetical protein